MKTIISAIFYTSEYQAIFQYNQYKEYSFCEARSYQDKRERMMGLIS